MADETLTPEQERDVLAGEHALAVLEGEELAAARQLVLADRDFAARVRWWNHWLANLAEAAGSVQASPEVWPAIRRRLGERGADVPFDAPATGLPAGEISERRGLAGAGLVTALIGAAAAAAAVTLFLTLPYAPAPAPAPVPTETAAQPGERLIAQLASDDGAITLAGLVDDTTGSLSLNIAGLEPGEGAAPELWVVPADGVPRSLGQIPASGSFSRELTPGEREFLVPGSALAVTYEDSTSIPHPAPTTTILVLGGLSEV